MPQEQTGVADVLDSTAEGGEIRVKLGYSISGAGLADNCSWWGPDGFISRPNPPSDEGAPMAFWLQGANRRYVIASRDNRFAEQVGELDPGDRAIVTDGEARVLVKKERDAVVLLTKNASTGYSMMLDMSGTDGEIKIVNGKSFFRIEKDRISMGVSGGCTLTLGADGVVSIDGAFLNCATGGGRLGVLGPQIPGPPAPAGSVLYGPAGMAGVASTSWTIVP